MTRGEFGFIIHDIESNIEGKDSYTLDIYTHAGNKLQGAWQFLIDSTANCVLVISASDQSPIYIPLSAIEFIALGK